MCATMRRMTSNSSHSAPPTARPRRATLGLDIRCCQDCRAYLPISFFGVNRRTVNGFAPRCKACRSDYTHRTKAKNIRNTPIRNVNHHNRYICNLASSSDSSTFSCVAFSTETFEDYRVVFEKESQLHKVSIWKPTSTAFDYTLIKALTYIPNEPMIQDQISYLLRNLNIRLELSDVDAHNSKRVVYLRP